VLIVGTDESAVEADLVNGRLNCPNCGSGLRPWGHVVERDVRSVAMTERRSFRRSICRSCGGTHVLVHEDTLVRRRDSAEVVGMALVAKARGDGHRRIARALGRPASTVRGWLRRFASRAGVIREHFTRWAHVVDPTHDDRAVGESGFSDAVSAIGVLGMVAVRRFGPRPVWSMASVVTGGGLLSNTSSPFRQPI
jgi:transposase-like protein